MIINTEIIITIIILFLFITLVLISTKKSSNKLLICPLRGKSIKKYDSKGNWTEEYQRIRLINYLLGKGYAKSQFILEHVIALGHNGNNSLRVDLAIKRANKFLIVAEIKKTYTKPTKLSAIKHQLVPAMRILNSKYGIYYDGTINSCLLIKNNDGSLVIRELNFN